MRLRVKGYEYYQIGLSVYPEAVKTLGDLFSFFAVETINEFVNSDLEEIKEKISKINGFEYYVYKRKNKVYKKVYVSKEIHDKWEQIPREYRRYLQFLINKKLLEVSKSWKKGMEKEMEMVEKG